MFILYYTSCPNCKNYERNMAREEALQARVELDDRFVAALPEIWGKEVEKIGAKVPFLYNSETGEVLELDHEAEGMRDRIRDFYKRV